MQSKGQINENALDILNAEIKEYRENNFIKNHILEQLCKYNNRILFSQNGDFYPYRNQILSYLTNKVGLDDEDIFIIEIERNIIINLTQFTLGNEGYIIIGEEAQRLNKQKREQERLEQERLEREKEKKKEEKSCNIS